MRVQNIIEAADGTQLFYRDWGTGAPVVFLSAWALTSQAWQYQMVRLTDEGLRCVAFDRRSHGRSSDPGRGYDLDTLSDDVASVLNSLDLKDVTLVGHSLGCAEAARYVLRHGSSRVAKLIMIAPALPYIEKAPDNPDGIDPLINEGFRNAFRMDFPGVVMANLRPFVNATTSQAMMDWVLQMMSETSLKALVDINRTVCVTDLREVLPKITLPTLILQGDADVSAPLPLTGQRTAALMPNAMLKVYAGAPHGLIFTHLDQVNEDLVNFTRSGSQS